jgi:UPF0716 protein FxsA
VGATPRAVGKLFALFVIVPLVELFLLVSLSDSIGVVGTIMLVMATGAVGAALAHAEGLKVMRSWQAALASGRMPEEGVISGAVVLLGGVLLITPGPITDILGLLMLVPLTRRYFLYMARAHLQQKLRHGAVRVFSYQWNEQEHGVTFTGHGRRSGDRSPHVDASHRGIERRPGDPPAAEPIQVRVIDTDGEPID